MITAIDSGSSGPIGSDNVDFPFSTVTPTDPTAYAAVVDVSAMGSGDTLVVRVTSTVLGDPLVVFEETRTDVQTKAVYVPPHIADETWVLSYEQTAGGGDVDIKYKVWAVA